MNKHEETLKISQDCYGMVKINMTQQEVWDCEGKIVEIQRYTRECEATEKAYEELKRDVKRLNELVGDITNICDFKDDENYDEIIFIQNKLSKVGGE